MGRARHRCACLLLIMVAGCDCECDCSWTSNGQNCRGHGDGSPCWQACCYYKPIVGTVFPHQNWALLRFREGWAVESFHWTEAPLARLSKPLTAACALHSSTSGSLKSLWKGTANLSVEEQDPRIEIRPPYPPAVWDTTSPVLHTVTCSLHQGGQELPPLAIRFGFRSFRAASGRFELNGRPIFLLGNSVNPPGRMLPDAVGTTHSFACSYLTDLKRRGINAVRIGDGVSQATAAWYDCADEIGILVYAGPYGNPVCPNCKGKPSTQPPPTGSVTTALVHYQRLLLASASHPSFVILILSNEVDIAGPMGHWGAAPAAAAYAQLLASVTEQLLAFDSTRAYLGDAGFGEGLGGEIFDDHTYYGWYQGDPEAYYLHEALPAVARGKAQPQTFTESVGNYLNAGGDFDVSGKNWAWSLKWTGPLQGGHEAARHAALVQRRSVEIVRRNRAINPHLAGIMPFAPPFFYCGERVTSFANVSQAPSPILTAAAASFKPILLSIESWTPHAYAAAASAVQVTIHVVNDDRRGADLAPSIVNWSLQCGDPCAPEVASVRGTLRVPTVSYYATHSAKLSIYLPASLPLGCDFSVCSIDASLHNHQLAAQSASNVTASETLTLFAALPRQVIADRPALAVYDPRGETLAALRTSGVAVMQIAGLSALKSMAASQPLLVGEDLDGEWRAGLGDVLLARLEAGGRVVLLQQSRAQDFEPMWLNPALLVFNMNVTLPHSGRVVGVGEPVHPQRPEHRVFHAPHRIERSWWSRWNLLESNWSPLMAQPESGSHLPKTSPAQFGLTLDVSKADFTSQERLESAGRRISPLMTHAMGSANQVLSEIFYGHARGASQAGHGVALLCGLGLVGRAGKDPVADRVLRNLATYAQSTTPPEPHPLFRPGESITWGNYTSEKGVAYSAPSGLLIQTCSYDDSCGSSYLGTWACGRFPYGPFDWTWMGHNRDLAPQRPLGQAAVFFRTFASTVTTVFEVTASTSLSPRVELQLLAGDFGVKATVACSSGEMGQHPIAICHLPSSQLGAPMAHRVAMRVIGPKTTSLKRTIFA